MSKKILLVVGILIVLGVGAWLVKTFVLGPNIENGLVLYRNKDYKFEFRYPEKLTLDDTTSKSVLLGLPGSVSAPISVGVYSADSQTLSSDPKVLDFAEIEKDLNSKERIIMDSPVMINGQNFVTHDLVTPDGALAIYVGPEFDLKGEKLKVVFIFKQTSDTPESRDDFSAIVNSFKFIK